ncbi:MAG: acetate/propionate family kinase [Planctomycetota bacterium]
MLILVANLGSTSFKYQLLNVSGDCTAASVRPADRVLAKGSIDRIGDTESRCTVTIGDYRSKTDLSVPDHGVAVEACLKQLTEPETGCLTDASEVAAIAFKAVHGGRRSGTVIVDDDVLDAMAEMNAAAPAHNPPYIAAMKLLSDRFPDLPLVAAFETEFHETIPKPRRTYAIERRFDDEFQIRKWGFHGASHRYIAERTSSLLERDDARVISCHLGGSSSLTAIANGRSVMTTMGMTPQTGLPQNNRVGDFDPFALPLLMDRTGLSLDDLLARLASEGGLKGISGQSGDLRDLESSAEQGDSDAQLALDIYVEEIRRHLGGMLVALGRTDAIVFTGGIGENSEWVRGAVCRELQAMEIILDPAKNHRTNSPEGDGERSLQSDDSRTQIWVIPTNEEWVVAKRAKAVLS